MTPAPTTARRRPRTLALELVESLGDRIRNGQFASGDKLPTESAIMVEFAVSRTVVREAISRLQAAGLVETRHGIGTFVLGLGDGPGFRIAPEQMATLRDVIAVLELRIGVETEAAALAAQRRTDADLQAMRAALDLVVQAIESGQDAVGADFQFHLEIARATRNDHFADLMTALGSMIIPRARLAQSEALDPERLRYLRRVNAEHESIFDAIASQDPDGARAAMRTHLANSRERRRRAQAEAA
jgi:GntR family transcriptional regulator, transcriptional repressor for pyruvate dehydrogenase complex